MQPNDTDVHSVYDELKRSTADATSTILDLADSIWPTRAPASLRALRHKVDEIVAQHVGSYDELQEPVRAAYKQMLLERKRPNAKQLCLLALLAGMARHRHHMGSRMGPIRPITPRNKRRQSTTVLEDAEAVVDAILQQFANVRGLS